MIFESLYIAGQYFKAFFTQTVKYQRPRKKKKYKNEICKSYTKI